MRNLLLVLVFIQSSLLFAQNPNKKTMTYEVYDIWNKIENTQISNNGEWVSYNTVPGKGDAILHIYNALTDKKQVIERATKPSFSYDNQYAFFTIKPPADSILAMRRRKVEDDDLPKDTLGILNLKTNEIERIPNLVSYKVPEKWAGYLAYQIESSPEEPNDSATVKIDTSTQTISLKWSKKESKKNGYRLVIRSLENNQHDTIYYVNHYTLAEEAPKILLSSTVMDSTFMQGVYQYNCSNRQLAHLYRGKGDFKHLNIDKQGEQFTFIANTDTLKKQVDDFGLYYANSKDTAKLIMKRNYRFMEKDWYVSEHSKPVFSEDGKRLFFGINPKPILQDTTLLPEEIVQVEVWNYQDKRLYPQQKVKLEEDKKKAYECVYDIRSKQFNQLGQVEIPTIEYTKEKNTGFALGYAQEPYLETISWEGFPSYKDIYSINLSNGNRIKLATKVKANPSISPSGKYFYWYSYPDTAWYAVPSNPSSPPIEISKGITAPLYDELNDRPMHPRPNGLAGWLEYDEAILIYDRYDIWKVSPNNSTKPQRLTNGRNSKTRYRIIRLDREKDYLPKGDLMLHVFNEDEATYAYAKLSPDGTLTNLIDGDYQFGRRPIKAQNANTLVFTKENFQTFPNLWVSNLNLENPTKISDANPQQKDYSWGTIEHYEWTSLDGQQLKGLLVKPENFDTSKKYPMIINFYERNSQNLYRHRAPEPHRSTINYSFYANQGYLIFNPDVPYKVGYPGESAYNAVVSGAQALIKEGFVDADNIGLQGHSWGGYQVAHIATKTDMFKCIESGAPVVNMFSAYGGIRWRTGLSRMFQYEHTQSRIGGTIWDKPELYKENSPIFNIDKIKTPILIMHNDKDGAVPWYQGIEFFVAMRRLGIPTWLLNYNDEPHWPVKRQNRIDFNRRMNQFFDYYLKGEKMPTWMERGVPALEKGILQGID